MSIIKEVRDIRRLKHIVIVLFEEGFEFLLERIKLRKSVPITKRIRARARKGGVESQLRRTLERLGPTFIKLGQILSVRPDLVPKNFIKELEKLQDSVEPFPYEEAKKVVENDLGKPLSEIFSSFEKKPIASASISQVHKATLKSGEKVAVKIQRPGVKKLMETDIEILFYFAKLIEKHHPKIREYKPVKVVEEFKEWTEKELDFRIEARNIKRFRMNFKKSKTAYIPEVYEALVSEKILVTEFIDGIELNKHKEIAKAGLNFGKILREGFEFALTQVFVYGFFHADPHPGNIIVTKKGRIGLVDFGIVGFFDDHLKEKSLDLFYGLTENDVDLVVETLLDMGMETEGLNVERFRSDIEFLIQPLQHMPIKDVKLSYVMEEVLDIALKHRLRVPAPFVLFGKTIVTLEGIALEYDPDFKLIEAAKPFVERMMKRKLSPKNIFKNLVQTTRRYRKLAENIPERVDRALNVVEKGTIRVDVMDTDIKNLALEIDKSSNRIAYGLIIAALLLVSALILQIDKGPKVFDIPVFSFLSFGFASILGMILFWSIVKKRHWLI